MRLAPAIALLALLSGCDEGQWKVVDAILDDPSPRLNCEDRGYTWIGPDLDGRCVRIEDVE